MLLLVTHTPGLFVESLTHFESCIQYQFLEILFELDRWYYQVEERLHRLSYSLLLSFNESRDTTTENHDSLEASATADKYMVGY